MGTQIKDFLFVLTISLLMPGLLLVVPFGILVVFFGWRLWLRLLLVIYLVLALIIAWHAVAVESK